MLCSWNKVMFRSLFLIFGRDFLSAPIHNIHDIPIYCDRNRESLGKNCEKRLQKIEQMQ